MKKRLVLLLILGISAIKAQSTAQPAKDSVRVKQEVVVFGKGLPFFLNDRTATLQVFDISQNRALPIRSVNEALSFVPGLDLRQRGMQGIQGDLSIRGGTFEQNLMLVNGFKLVDPQTGHHALNLPVLLTNVHSIEVYKGSGTRIFGQNAMTGAVNFVTQPSKSYGANMQLYGADFGGLGFQSTVNAPIGKLRQSVSFGYDKSNGNWYNSDHSNQQVFYDAVLPLKKKHELKALLGYTDRAFGANGYYSNAFPDQWESTQMAMAGISHQVSLTKLTLLTKASLRTHRDEFRLIRNDPSFYTNKHWSEVITLEETGKLSTKLGTTGFGGECRVENLNSSNLGQRQRTYVSGFIDHTLKLFQQKLILVANVHYFNLAMDSMIYHKILPGVEVAFMPVSTLKIFGNIGKSYRAPTYTELYYQDPSNLGNPKLAPEYATNAELGVSWTFTWGQAVSGSKESYKSRISIDAAVYRRNTSNMIDWIRSTTSIPNPWMPVNISNVIFTGVETNVSYRWNGSGVIMLRELSLGYNYTDANHQFQDALFKTQSRYAFSGLRNQLVGRMTVNLSRWVTLSAAYRGIDRVGGNAYSLVDVKLAIHANRNVTLFGEGNNVLNTKYIEAGYVQMPGRWWKAGLQINLSDN